MDIQQQIRQRVTLRRFLVATALAQSPGTNLTRVLQIVNNTAAAHPEWPLDEERSWVEWSAWTESLEAHSRDQK